MSQQDTVAGGEFKKTPSSVFKTESTMRIVGFWIFVPSALFGVAACINATTAETLFVGWTFASLAGIGLFMWLLGIIEQRLIEIRDALHAAARKPDAHGSS